MLLLLYTHDSRGFMERIFRPVHISELKTELKKMNREDEKYRIKPRKKYARQVWLLNGKALIVEPLEVDPSETAQDKKEENREVK